MDLTAYIRDIPDFPKPGILFKDITPLLADPTAFQVATDLLFVHYAGDRIAPLAGGRVRGSGGVARGGRAGDRRDNAGRGEADRAGRRRRRRLRVSGRARVPRWA